MTVALFAGIRVRDLTAARAWYERLLGEPSFFPNATEVVWTWPTVGQLSAASASSAATSGA
jgi:hypothetical protein